MQKTDHTAFAQITFTSIDRRSGLCNLSNLRRLMLGLGLLAGVAAQQAQAVDVDAGDYTALPAGTNLAILYAQHAERDALYAQGKKAPINARLDSNVGIARGVHYMDIGGYIVDPQFLLPFGQLEAKGDLSALGKGSGVGDLILAATVWVVNQPKTNTYFGITPFLFLPTGGYDKNKALNLGENRWKLALQGGFITGLTDKLLLDVIGDVTVYGKNSEFGASNASMKQDASFQLQTFLRYNLTPALDLRAGLSYTTGGETKVNGVAQNDEARNSKMTLGAAYFVRPTTQLIFNYGRDLSVHNGFKESNRLNFRILQVF